ncbi:L,D-transpeptidase family protein [Porphyrobacter sp. AAP82]|uniref:L,D-transpeptidase family protein n=1 Tax=Porphyrobacter sp. AAP82 TaxID=1248917 RepID=UPI0022770CF8|nr:L,D-transpeptidase family protein [Porphyrobacter sp. AAP82]
MRRLRLYSVWLLPAALLALASLAAVVATGGASPVSAPAFAAEQVAADPVPAVAPPLSRTVGQVLQSGVVITVSLKTQQMHVFRDGVLWRSSPVSTGKRGKRTPTGTFAILQKKRYHRSNLYSNAPMPWMQRLTWSGIAIHAGRLPGYPASHGCIRIPAAFAAELFKITGPTTTAVIVTDEPLADGGAALALAQRSDAVVPIAPALLQRERPALAAAAPTGPAPRLPAARTIPVSPTGVAGQQTIQLAAALSAAEAAAQWETLTAQRPVLKGMRMAVIPAMVNGKQYYRLRASAPDAHATCKALKRAGIACFPVI